MNIYTSAQEFIRNRYPGSVILLNEPLKKHTSFRIGGPVPMLVIPDSKAALIGIREYFLQHGLSPLLLGRGTNILAEDCEFDFPVIKTHGGLKEIKLLPNGVIYAEAGVTLAQAAVFAMKNSLAGLEFAHGIPGTLGGGVYMNAGAYGGEMADVVFSTDAVNDSGVYTVTGGEHEFSYRHSVFERESGIVLSSLLRLTPGSESEISDKMEELMSKRRASQPLDMPSAGSTFKRPVGGYAAAMIDQCGLKGFAFGGAQVSEKHAGFVINRGDASFSDVMQVISHVQNEVYKKFGVHLETEVKIITRQ